LLWTKFDKFVKSHFANDIEPFWKKIQNEPGVKNFKLFEGVSHPKIAHGERKIRLFTKPSNFIVMKKQIVLLCHCNNAR